MTLAQLRELQKRKRQIQREIAVLQEALEDIENVEKMISAAAQKHAPGAGADRPSSRASGGRKTVSKPARIVAATKKILSGADHPMSISELMDALKDEDLHLHGANPANTLGTILSRNKATFVNLVRFGYWLRERSYPAAGHEGNSVPDDEDDEDDEADPEDEEDDRLRAVV